MEHTNVSSTVVDKKLKPLSVVEKAGYAAGDAASNIYFHIFITFLMIFYTDAFGLPAAAMGTMFWESRVVDAIIDPLLGAQADRPNPRCDKFRPVLFFFADPVACRARLA